MALIEGGVSAAVAGVGAEAGSPLHIVARPITPGVLGHYRTSHRCLLANTQAATSKLFEFQNASATNLIVITRIDINVRQVGAFTAAIEDSFDVFRTTGHSVISTTNTVTPVISKLRTSYGTPGAVVRGVTVAGAAAGMTGFTLTKDTAPLFQIPIWFLLAVPTGGATVSAGYDWSPNIDKGESPLILAQNEGFVLDNRVLLGAAAGASVYIDVAWAEVAAY